jgi:hypothetical protein
MTSTAATTTIPVPAPVPVSVSVSVVRELRDHVEAVMAGFDVGLVTASDAAAIGREVTRLKRRFEAVELACAKRVADTTLVRSRADHDGAGNGRWRLPPAQHAELLAALNPVRDRIFTDARRAGRREPHEAYDADALVQLAHDAATYNTHPDTSDDTASDSPHADNDHRAAPTRAQRTHDGETDGQRPPTDELVHATVTTTNRPDGQLTLVPSTPDRQPETNRPPGQPPGSTAEPPHLQTDAVPNPPPAPEPSPAHQPPPGTRRSRPRRGRDKIIFRIDWTAATRGHTLPAGGTGGTEETCDIVGIGPVPVPVVHQLLQEDPFIAVVLTEGNDIRAVTHLGRNATALMRTSLEWHNQGCSVLGCANTGRLELDHRADWAHTLHTRLDQLDWLCPRHHQQKTHDGHQLEPGTGKRRFLPPPDP